MLYGRGAEQNGAVLLRFDSSLFNKPPVRSSLSPIYLHVGLRRKTPQTRFIYAPSSEVSNCQVSPASGTAPTESSAGKTASSWGGLVGGRAQEPPPANSNCKQPPAPHHIHNNTFTQHTQQNPAKPSRPASQPFTRPPYVCVSSCHGCPGMACLFHVRKNACR